MPQRRPGPGGTRLRERDPQQGGPAPPSPIGAQPPGPEGRVSPQPPPAVPSRQRPAGYLLAEGDERRHLPPNDSGSGRGGGKAGRAAAGGRPAAPGTARPRWAGPGRAGAGACWAAAGESVGAAEGRRNKAGEALSVPGRRSPPRRRSAPAARSRSAPGHGHLPPPRGGWP